MAWLPMYLAPEDVPILLEFLNNEAEIAWLLNDGKPGRWRAHATMEKLLPERYAIWHVPSGPLPLLAPRGQTDGFVRNAWMGWNEQRAGADPTTPHFGPGHPGMFWLNMSPIPRREDEVCGLSAFEWIGGHYSILGSSPTPETRKWWQRLRRQIAKLTVKVPRGSLNDSAPLEIYAFPTVYKALQSGARASINPSPTHSYRQPVSDRIVDLRSVD